MEIKGAAMSVHSSDGRLAADNEAFLNASGHVRFATVPMACVVSTCTNNGYWLASSDGSVYVFGVPFCGSLPSEGKTPSAPIVGIAATPGGNGYWLVGSDGRIFNFGTAGFEGSMGAKPLNAPVVAITASTQGSL